MVSMMFMSQLTNPPPPARTVPGYGDDRMMLEEALKLGSLIKEAGDDRNVLFDSYFTVGYDSPYKLFNRKNEIWFVKLDP